MKSSKGQNTKQYKTIIIGAGASGLYCACSLSKAAMPALILERTNKPGTKLLMAGGGQCNVTHGGSIKDFVSHYGKNGKKIRGVLQKHNNLELHRFFESLSIHLVEREDGKIFPASMRGRDILDALLAEISRKGVETKYNAKVVEIIASQERGDLSKANASETSNAANASAYETTNSPKDGAYETTNLPKDSACETTNLPNDRACEGTNLPNVESVVRGTVSANAEIRLGANNSPNVEICRNEEKGQGADDLPNVEICRKTNLRFTVKTQDDRFSCDNLVIATGGCSYPTTGSDGQMFEILRRDLNVEIAKPSPALTSVKAEKYPYEQLTGIGFKEVSLKITTGKEVYNCQGDLLFAGQKLSGPVILNNSRYMEVGSILQINYISPTTGPEAIARFKAEFPGNGKSPQTYVGENFNLPKRFVQKIVDDLNIGQRKVSHLTGAEMKALAVALTEAPLKISSLSGFKEAMVTRGGVALSQIKFPKMESATFKGLYFIGEAVDIDGDTGGYNLQFAYSSARAAADNIE